MASESMVVSLAHTPPFALGRLRIVPDAREIEDGDACETVEPLVMQVLVVLARHSGTVVSRDLLIECCWDGRAISDDALNRVVAKVRRISEGVGRGAFHIETVTKVGYRLRVDDPVGSPPIRPSGLSDTDRRAAVRHWLAASSLVVAALIGAVLLDGAPLLPRRAAVSTTSPNAARPSAPLVGAATNLETRGLSLLFQGTPEQTGDGIAYLRQATAAAPREASLWGSLAMGYVLALANADQASVPATIDRAKEAARQGLALDPSEGRSTAALVSLTPSFRHWSDKDTQLRTAMAHATPESPPLLFQRAQFLASVGRTDEALAVTDHLSAISPLVPWIQSLRARLLAARGRPDRAQQVADYASGLWPRDRLTWFTRFDLALYGGRPREAVAMADDRASWPRGAQADIADRLAIARLLIAPDPARAERLLGRLATRGSKDRTAAETAVQAAAVLGRPQRALALVRRMYDRPGVLTGRGVIMPRVGSDDGHERNTALLFWPPVARLRGDPAYTAVLRDLGLGPATH